ncbi:MAG: DUF6785 family protein [Candidatus Poribacteria bacterium]
MTLRAILIGITWVIIQSIVAPYNNYYIRGSSLSGNHFPVTSVFILTLLCLVVNVIIKKVKPGRELSAKELATVWIMTVIASGIPSWGLIAFLAPLLASPLYFATPENEWDTLLRPHLPDWAIVSSKKAATDFYEGSMFANAPVPWEAWIKPVLFWSAFAILCYLATLCLCSVLRRQWTERERFTYPLVKVPVEMIQKPKSNALLPDFFRNRLVWIGIAIPVVLHTINGLHRFFPAVPEIPTRFNLYEPFTERPWVVIRWWPAAILWIFPSVIGVSYLLPLEISLSFWFFYVFFKLQYIFIVAFSIPISPWTCASRQAMGSTLVIAGFILWIAREHIWNVFRKAFSSGDTVDDADEPLPYRWALRGFIIGLILMALLCFWAGVSFKIALVIMIIFFLVSLVMTWMVVNGGMFLVQAPFYPSDYLVITMGSRAVGAANLAVLGIPQHALMRSWGELMMPHIMHGFKISDSANLKQRHTVVMIGIAILLGLAVSYYSTLKLAYSKGAVNLSYGGGWYSRTPYRIASSFMQNPVGVAWGEFYSIIIGVVATVAMIFMRYRFIWALHPIGYAVGASYAPYFLWSSLFIGWLIKYIVLHFGGLRYYRSLLPLFLGLIFGDYIIAGVWIIIGLITGVGYHFLPVP